MERHFILNLNSIYSFVRQAVVDNEFAWVGEEVWSAAGWPRHDLYLGCHVAKTCRNLPITPVEVGHP